MPENTPTPLSPLLTGLLRLFFRLLYHSFAGGYDFVANTVSLGQWTRWVLASAKMLNGPRVLELGFGTGHLQEHQLASGVSVFGLDESRQMAGLSHRRLIKAGFLPRLSRGTANYLPYASGVFQNVVATFPTSYIVEPETLAEILRVLAPGGRLVVLMSAWITGKRWRERMLTRLFRATAQVPPEDVDINEFLQPYQAAGFQASLRFVEQPGARLMFILARKTA
jgi:ubiquinone/menaquinone biosynthesis C-methylase UbiE